jgi:hypothetical protein
MPYAGCTGDLKAVLALSDEAVVISGPYSVKLRAEDGKDWGALLPTWVDPFEAVPEKYHRSYQGRSRCCVAVMGQCGGGVTHDFALFPGSTFFLFAPFNDMILHSGLSPLRELKGFDTLATAFTPRINSISIMSLVTEVNFSITPRLRPPQRKAHSHNFLRCGRPWAARATAPRCS